MSNVRWLPIPGFSRYEASSAGEIRQIASKRYCALMSFGDYVVVSVKTDTNRWRDTFVHVLVMRAFVGPKPVSCHVHHIDLNPSNNKVANLQYLTFSEHKREHLNFA